jgi:hypothetical protein
VNFIGLNSVGRAGVADGFFSIDFGPYVISCTPGCGGGPLLPIRLGTAYTFFEVENADATSAESHGGATVAGSLTAQFFEADGVTPVNVVEATPEPHAGALVAVGLLCLQGSHLLKRLRRREWPPKLPEIALSDSPAAVEM